MKFEKIKLALEPITELRKGKLYILLFVALIYTTGYGILYPFYPTLVTNFFAKRITGNAIDCTNLKSGSEYEDICKKAHTQSVFWNTVESFCALFLGIFINPVFSRWSDFYGRKLFYMFGLVSGIWPAVMVFLYQKFNTTFFLYYVAQAINDSYASPVIAFAFASDVINKKYTPIIYGFIIGIYMLGFLISSIIVAVGLLEDSLHASLISIAMILIAILLVLVIPESTTYEKREKAKLLAKEIKGNRNCSSNFLFAFKSFKESLKILWRNSEFIIIATVIFLFSMLNFQFFDIIFQYLQEVAGFGTSEQSILSIIKFSGFIFIMFAGSYFFLNILKISEKQFLLISLSFSAIKQLILIFCKSPILAYVAEGIGSFDSIIFPTLNSICSKMAKNTEQGSAMGAIMSVKSFAQGLGPIIILGIYIVFRLDDFIYFPGAPFVYSLLVIIIATIVLTRLNVKYEEIVDDDDPLIGNSN